MALHVVDTTRFSVDTLENASADLYVADILLTAVDNFLDEIGDWVKPGGLGTHEEVLRQTLCERVLKETHSASTLLHELSDKLHRAKSQIEGAVEAAIADGLSRR